MSDIKTKIGIFITNMLFIMKTLLRFQTIIIAKCSFTYETKCL